MKHHGYIWSFPFEEALDNMKQINPQTVPWLYANAHPVRWAELYFHGRRYGHLTSNIAELLNAKLLPAREMPILALLESIRSTLMDWFSQKRQLEANTPGIIVRKVATQIQDANHPCTTEDSSPQGLCSDA